MSKIVKTPAKIRGGPPPDRFSIEYLTDPKNIAALLHRTWDLSDEAYYDLIDDIGTRAARLVLRTKALSGDVRALDLYWRVTKEERSRKRGEDLKTDARTSEVQAELMQRPRTPPAPQDVDDGNAT